jgi:hypothetical protein
MQSYGELKHLVNKFNELVFGSGFYYCWNYEHKRSMRENISRKQKGETLLIESMFDPCYAHSIEIYLKNCTAHNLPKDYWIPDHWKKPPFEIQYITFATEEENPEGNLVKEFTMKLYFHTLTDEIDFYWIKASRFYFDKVR